MTLIADFNSSVNVPFQRMRQMLMDGTLQEGVVGANDFKVVQRGAGANQSVDVGTGFAWVQIDTGTRNGMGHVTNDATANVTVTASNATNPRIDQILLRWNDSSIPTGSGNVPTLEVATGTPTAGATLDNRNGAITGATLNDTLRLADILVPAASTSVTTANIRDRRPWARGAFNRILRSQNAAAGTNYTTAVTTVALVDSTNLQPRIECSGAPVRLKIDGAMSHSVSGGSLFIGFWMDGAVVDLQGTAAGGNLLNLVSPSNIITNRFTIVQDIVPPAGSHLFGPVWALNTAGSATLYAATAGPTVVFSVEEIVRQNASNT